MVLTNLDQSGFRKLNLIKPTCDPPTADGGTGRDNGNRNPDLVMLLEQYFHKIVDKSVEPNKIDVCQLLAQPSFGMSIDKFISKQERKCLDSKKSAAKSAIYRTWGNKDYLRGRFSSAAYYYTMAIIYAPDVPENVGDDNVDEKKIPEELSLAYGNRSAVFYELGQYEAALTDIDHSLATGYSREKLPKLLLRKVECLISLKHLRDAKRVWEHLSFSDAELKDYEDQVLKIRFQLLRVDSNDECDSQKQSQSATDRLLAVLLNLTGRYQPSTDFASISTKVEPKYSEAKSKGRHLVAKQDIEPGDILMVESPFASVLSKHFEYHFCHHCYRKLESKIVRGTEDDELCIAGSVVPCTECTRVLYCSSDCRTKAWSSYHQYECSILPILHEMSHGSHLSLRMLLTTGLDVFQQVSDRNSQTEDASKDPLSSLKITDPNDSVAQYELVHQVSDQQDEQLPAFVILSAVLLQLTKKCAFVRTAEQEKLASSILLRQLLQLYSNACKIAGFEFSEPDKAHDFARGLYPTLSSLINHSCEPNSEFTFVQSTVLILRATKKILVDSQVTFSDGFGFFLHQEFPERRKIILENWGFHCECTRCVLEARDGLNGKYFPIGCKVCGSTLTRTSSSSDTFNCSSSSCAAFMSLTEVKQLYARIESRLAITDSRILSYGKSPNPEPNFALLKCELDLDELSNMPGLRNFWKLGDLHRRLGLAFGRFRIPDVRRHFARFCEISEANSGIVNAARNYEKLIDLYRKFHVHGDDEGNVIKEYRRIGQRLIELVRLTLIADVEPPTDGPDLLEEESRGLRKLYRDVVVILNGLPKEE